MLTIFLGGCSSQVEITEGKFGILLRLGKVEGVVSGPSVIDKSTFTTILLINKNDEIFVQQGMFRLAYVVTDPKEYYIKFGIMQNQLQQFIEEMITSNSNKTSNISELVKSMNLPIAIKTYCRMPC
jgi:hypothetical protein